jgi:opacity protein-like surface antigen
MKFNPLVSALALSTTLLAATGYASSWTEDDSSWKTASPYYYGDNTAPMAKDNYAGRSSHKRKKVEEKTVTPFSPESNNVSLDIGQNFLVGSQFQDSIGMQGTYTYGISRLLAFTASLGYSSHSEGQYSKLALTGGPRLNLASYDRITPYVTGGLGFYHANDQLSAGSSIGGTMFGINFGGGADLSLTKETFFGASMTYHQLFGTKKDTSIGTIDIASDYLTFMAHVGYTF